VRVRRLRVRVRRLRQYFASITITPVAVVLLVVPAVAFGLFAFGPADAQMPAMIACVILLIAVIGGLPLGLNGGGWRNVSLAERRRDFAPTDRRDVAATAADPQAEEELWRKERERYAQDQRSG
jgi:hypothetical protein